MKTRVNDNQSMADIAVQVSGSVESSFEIAVKNNQSVTGILTAGQELDKSSAVNTKVVDQLAVQKAIPATASKKVIEEKLDGIGNMVIGQNFIVG